MDDFISGDTLQERYADILNKSKYSDMVLKVKYKKDNDEDGEVLFKCHRILLKTASAYFMDCLVESASEVVIEESNIKLFKIIIDYIYTRHVDISALETNDIISLILLGYKYKLPELMEFCGNAVNENPCCIRHLVKFFNIAIQYNISGLQKSCLRIIREHAGNLFRHGAFIQLSPEAVEMILKEDELNITEMEIFQTILTWAEHKYNEERNISIHKIYNYTSSTDLSNYPFGLRCIENKILSIVKVEPMDSNMSGLPQLNAAYSVACNERSTYFLSRMDNKPADYWSNIRRILDQYKLTKHIRFLALDPSEFCKKISCGNILTMNELSDVLIILNSSDLTLKAPPELSNVRKPRLTYSSEIMQSNRKLRIHARLHFEFLHSHVFNNEIKNSFTEEFRTVSAQPILLMSIILPPKHRKGNIGHRYLEDVFIIFFKKSFSGGDLERFASASFQGRRKYEENISLMLSYNVKDNSDALLSCGTEFVVQISNISTGAYTGGLTRTSLNSENQFIVTSNKIQKGIIAGFGFCFDIGL